jgi:polar amino acid transport system substrate-binding protein
MKERRLRLGLSIAVLAVAGGFALLLSGCGGDDAGSNNAGSGGTASGETDSSASTEGTLKIGTATAPPWVLFDPNKREYFGPSVTLFNAIAKALNKKVEYVDTGYATAIAGLQSRQFDIIGLPLFDTPERKEVVDFALWTASGNCYVALKSNEGLNTLADLNDPEVTMAVTTGASIETDFPKKYPEAKTYSIQATGAAFPIQEVLSGRADITVIDAPLAYKFQQVYPQLKTIPDPETCLAEPDFPHNIGVAFRKSESAEFKQTLQDVVNSLRSELAEQIKTYSAPEYIELPDE